MDKVKHKRKQRIWRSKAANKATLGCGCTKCKKANAEWALKQRREHNLNMGKVQHGAREKGWSFGSGEDGEGGYVRPVERWDKEERQAHGRMLQAGYRPIIGSTPECIRGNTAAAFSFLQKVEHAIEVGGWTRSEWQRLYTLRDKWKKRSNGEDERFNKMGNSTLTLSLEDRWSRAAAKLAKSELKRHHSNGD